MGGDISCPACGGGGYKRVRFSPRHGLAGSVLMSLAECSGCGATYNRKGVGALTPRGYRRGATAFVILLLLLGFIVLVSLVTSGQFDQQIKALLE